jgi:hypothetical protein
LIVAFLQVPPDLDLQPLRVDTGSNFYQECETFDLYVGDLTALTKELYAVQSVQYFDLKNFMPIQDIHVF